MNDTILTKTIYIALAILIILAVLVPAKNKIKDISVKATNNVITSDERFDIN